MLPPDDETLSRMAKPRKRRVRFPLQRPEHSERALGKLAPAFATVQPRQVRTVQLRRRRQRRVLRCRPPAFPRGDARSCRVVRPRLDPIRFQRDCRVLQGGRRSGGAVVGRREAPASTRSDAGSSRAQLRPEISARVAGEQLRVVDDQRQQGGQLDTAVKLKQVVASSNRGSLSQVF